MPQRSNVVPFPGQTKLVTWNFLKRKLSRDTFVVLRALLTNPRFAEEARCSLTARPTPDGKRVEIPMRTYRQLMAGGSR